MSINNLETQISFLLQINNKMLRFKLRKIDAEYFGSESDPGLISKPGQSLNDDWLTELNQSRQ